MNKILFVLMIASSVLLSACGGQEPADERTASLVVKVIHADATTVTGATVNLYESLDDYQNETNSVATLTTDELGEVYFTDLSLKQYWFIAKFDGFSNSSSIFSTGRKLNADERMEKITQLRK